MKYVFIQNDWLRNYIDRNGIEFYEKWKGLDGEMFLYWKDGTLFLTNKKDVYESVISFWVRSWEDHGLDDYTLHISIYLNQDLSKIKKVTPMFFDSKAAIKYINAYQMLCFGQKNPLTMKLIKELSI
jgi:hypothetical protein